MNSNIYSSGDEEYSVQSPKQGRRRAATDTVAVTSTRARIPRASNTFISDDDEPDDSKHPSKGIWTNSKPLLSAEGAGSSRFQVPVRSTISSESPLAHANERQLQRRRTVMSDDESDDNAHAKDGSVLRENSPQFGSIPSPANISELSITGNVGLPISCASTVEGSITAAVGGGANKLDDGHADREAFVHHSQEHSMDATRHLVEHHSGNAETGMLAEAAHSGKIGSNLRRQSYVSSDSSSDSAAVDDVEDLAWSDLQCCSSSVREASSDSIQEHMDHGQSMEQQPGLQVDETSHHAMVHSRSWHKKLPDDAPFNTGSPVSQRLGQLDLSPCEVQVRGKSNKAGYPSPGDGAALERDDESECKSSKSWKQDVGGSGDRLYGDIDIAILQTHLDEFEGQQLKLQEKLQALSREREMREDKVGKCRRTVEELEVALASERQRRKLDVRLHEEELESQLLVQDERWQAELQRLRAEVQELKAAAEAELKCSEMKSAVPSEVVTASARAMASSYVKQLGNCFANALAHELAVEATADGNNKSLLKDVGPAVTTTEENLSLSPAGGELQKPSSRGSSRIHTEFHSVFTESPMSIDPDDPLNFSGMGELFATPPTDQKHECSSGMGSASGNIRTGHTKSPSGSYILISPSTDFNSRMLLPPPMPSNTAVAQDACWTIAATPPCMGRAVSPRSSPARLACAAVQQRGNVSRSSTPPPAPSHFAWRLPVFAQLPGAPQFGSPDGVGSIVHRVPCDVGAAANPPICHGQKASPLTSLTTAVPVAARTPPRGRP